jgi:predicted N-acetyltransferase YhbS
LRFEPMGSQDRAQFVSGSDELDDWFRHRAGQDQRRNMARVFVALDDTDKIVGFYSLSAFSVGPEDFAEEHARKLPRYDVVPAVLIGRLARHVQVRGEVVGPSLVADAISRLLDASDSIGVHAIVVDAKDGPAAAFYRTFGFIEFPDARSRLFLPLATARKANPGR